jgi:glycerophosphoryl diester phosphodiesterase
MTAAIYGHRGARAERPENTLEGFRHALACGVAGIETDIAVTADFIPVLHHDARLADGRLIRHMARADLPAFIPTLAEALAEIPVPQWLLEIKTYPDQPEDSHPAAQMAAATLAALAGADPSRIAILAFDWSVLRAIAAQAPALRRVCLTAPETEAARRLWWGPDFAGLTTPQAVAATGAWGWAAFAATLQPPQIREAHARGLRVLAWTVNDPAEVGRLAPLADGLITDHPARYAP